MRTDAVKVWLQGAEALEHSVLAGANSLSDKSGQRIEIARGHFLTALSVCIQYHNTLPSVIDVSNSDGEEAYAAVQLRVAERFEYLHGLIEGVSREKTDADMDANVEAIPQKDIDMVACLADLHTAIEQLAVSEQRVQASSGLFQMLILKAEQIMALLEKLPPEIPGDL